MIARNAWSVEEGDRSWSWVISPVWKYRQWYFWCCLRKIDVDTQSNALQKEEGYVGRQQINFELLDLPMPKNKQNNAFSVVVWVFSPLLEWAVTYVMWTQSVCWFSWAVAVLELVHLSKEQLNVLTSLDRLEANQLD